MSNIPCISKFRKLLSAGILILLLTFSSCYESFEPIIKDKAAFSIQGFLDTSIDTQWVRLTPLRDQVSQPEFKPEMTVTLQNLENGETVTMNDSLILNPNGFHYLNVWTSMDIKSNHSYHLKTERPDGSESHVTVSIPDDFPTPLLHLPDDGGAEWNEEITSLEDIIYYLPDIYSNIDNGVGYLVGVNSKAIPYKSCYNDDSRTELIACPEVKPIY